MSTEIASQPPMDTALEKKMEVVGLGGKDAAATTAPIPVATALQEKGGPRKVPFEEPAPSAKPTPHPELTADQQEKYDFLLEAVKSWTEIPSTIGKEGPIREDEIMWLTRECLLRYLRATKWVTVDASKRLLATLTWRREYGVLELTGDHVSPENETGKQLILGYDVAARPCLYLSPGRQNTSASPRQVQHLVFSLERAIDLMVPGQDSLALLIDQKASKTRGNTAPPLSQGREVLNILQTHYPERLGRACISNVPWIVWGFYKLITPFIDPLTREKLKFNEDVRLYVPPQQLWKECNGDVDFEYDHDVYWPSLLKLCEERHSAQKERWEKAGKNYGESETYLRGVGPVPEKVALSTQSREKTILPETEVAEETSNGKTDFAAVSEDSKLSTE